MPEIICHRHYCYCWHFILTFLDIILPVTEQNLLLDILQGIAFYMSELCCMSCVLMSYVIYHVCVVLSCVFVNDLFNNAVTNSECILSSDRMINE
jgi:hypothetical protein